MSYESQIYVGHSDLAGLDLATRQKIADRIYYDGQEIARLTSEVIDFRLRVAQLLADRDAASLRAREFARFGGVE